jgi:hypothetical protein
MGTVRGLPTGADRARLTFHLVRDILALPAAQAIDMRTESQFLELPKMTGLE